MKRVPSTDAEAWNLERAAAATFAEHDPNPELAIEPTGKVVYANGASRPILDTWRIGIGGRVPPTALGVLAKAGDPSAGQRYEVRAGRRTFLLRPVEDREAELVRLYGTDVTAEKLAQTFPDRNPNPVMQLTSAGILVYANAASHDLLAELRVRVADPFPPALLDRLRRAFDRAGATVEVSAGMKTYWLTAVRLPASGALNVYGFDVPGQAEPES